MRIFRRIALCLSACIALSSCNESSSSTQVEETSPTGSVAFRLPPQMIDSLRSLADSLKVVADNGNIKCGISVPLGGVAELTALPPGIWNVLVTLTKEGETVYQGSGFATVVGGGTALAKISLLPVSGNLLVEIDIGSERRSPRGLVGAWNLKTYQGSASFLGRPSLRLLESGASIGSGFWESSREGAWSADDSIVWLDNDRTIDGRGACLLMAPSGTPLIPYCSLFGKPLRWSIAPSTGDMSLIDPKTRQILATFAPITALSEHGGLDPAALAGVWGLLSMPIEDLDHADGSTLIFDSTGRISGYIACNLVGGSWDLDRTGKLLVKLTKVSPSAICQDPNADLVVRGVHLMESGPMRWSIDTTGSGQERIHLFGSLTGAEMAVFSLARLGKPLPVDVSDAPSVTVVTRPVDSLVFRGR